MKYEDAIDWNNKGYCLAGKGLQLEAIEAYNHAISLDPTNPIFHKNREKALSALKRQEKENVIRPTFKDTIEQKTKSKQDFAIEWNNRAGALFKEGKINEAVLAYDRAISLDPTHPIFWKNKAKALKNAGRVEEATSAQELSESITAQKKLQPSDDAVYWNNKGYTLAEDGKHIEAIDAFNRAIKIFPNFPDAYNNLGYSLAELGRIDEAITACYRAVELKPEFAYSWIEKWLFLPEWVANPARIIPVSDGTDCQDDDDLTSCSPIFCNHMQGPVEMEPLFIRSKKNGSHQYSVFAWVCPDCGQFRRT